MRKDKQATAARHFLCPKSYVTPDGKEVLFREDWLARVVELDKRCGGRCEFLYGSFMTTNGNLIRVDRCASAAMHPHHKIKRSDGRDDRIENLMALCAFHHELLHPEKRIRSDKAERVSGSI